jgi:hypothetical protein
MNYNKMISDTCVRVGEVRFSYANVFAPKRTPNGQEKYSCAILIPKDNKAALDMINQALENTKLIGKSSQWGGTVPRNFRSPLRDGDEDRPDDDNYAGCYFINASANPDKKPQVKVVQDGQMFDALDQDDFYSGCYGAAVLNFFPYDNSGNRGIGAGLNFVVKTRDGDKLSGGVSEASALGDMLG